MIWDPLHKPKGVFGGHINIRSLTPKADQVHHLLHNSNLDFHGCIVTLHLQRSISLATKSLDRTDLLAEGVGVMIYIKEHFNCNQICWPFNVDIKGLGLNIMLSPEMSFKLIVVSPTILQQLLLRHT